MATLKFSCTRRAGWHKNLLPLVVMGWVGFAGSTSAASMQPKASVPAPFECSATHLPEGSSSPLESFQAGIDEVAREFGKDRSHRLTSEQRRARAEFVFGNMLFVTAHELGHALVSELDLMVLAREEDVADAYATIGVLKCGADFARRVLVEAAKGLFLNAQRDKKAGDVPQYYERHGLDEQRAYQIVCLMYGSDQVRFKDLADETQLPQDRRRSCGWDYDTASRSWDRALAPHLRTAEQPKPRIEVIYGEAKGNLATYARVFKAARFLETVIEQVADRFAWPASIAVEMRSCGDANARWTIPTRRLHVCYELAEEFVELYHDYGVGRTLAQARVAPRERIAARAPNLTQAIGAWKRVREPESSPRTGESSPRTLASSPRTLASNPRTLESSPRSGD
jgi:Putative metallopeptidase